MRNFELEIQKIKQSHKHQLVENLIKTPITLGPSNRSESFSPLPVYPDSFIKKLDSRVSLDRYTNRHPVF